MNYKKKIFKKNSLNNFYSARPTKNQTIVIELKEETTSKPCETEQEIYVLPTLMKKSASVPQKPDSVFFMEFEESEIKKSDTLDLSVGDL